MSTRPFLAPAVRATLREYPDGLTAQQIGKMLERNPRAVARIAANMPDAYVDRWTRHGRYMVRVWCVVVPPEDCPPPEHGLRNGPKVPLVDIRALLRQSAEGLSTREVAAALQLPVKNAYKVMLRLPEAYVCRWLPYGHRCIAVWKAADSPEMCPPPPPKPVQSMFKT